MLLESDQIFLAGLNKFYIDIYLFLVYVLGNLSLFTSDLVLFVL